MNQKISPDRAVPRAARRPFTDTHHGIVREDDYAWLRASNWQEVMRDPAVLDPAIRAHLEAENAYSKNEMADIEKGWNEITDELGKDGPTWPKYLDEVTTQKKYFEDGENCLLADPDAGARVLADALVRLADDSELRSRLRAGGLGTAERYPDTAFASAVADAAAETAAAA